MIMVNKEATINKENVDVILIVEGINYADTTLAFL